MGDRFIVAAVILVSLLFGGTARADQTLASVGTAFVSRDAKGESWTVGNEGVALTLGFDSRGDLHVLALKDGAATRPSLVSAGPDAVVALNGEQYTVGTKSHGFTLATSRATELAKGVRLDLIFDLRDPHARVTRSYVCYLGAAVIESWTTIEASDKALTAGDLNVWQIATPRGAVRWQTGLQATADDGGSFTIKHRTLASGERLALGAADRASERVVPVFALELGDRELFAGLMWSGGWTAWIDAIDDTLQTSIGLSGFASELSAGSELESPHGFIGVSTDAAATSATLARFALALRRDRVFPALVTYNTWFAYGTRVDERIMLDEITRAADMGVEVFVLDAGWYPDAGRDGMFDFTSGLGALRPDEARFPNGLRALSDAAHELGIKFGIWVEPARTALSLVGTDDGPKEEWLATRDGKYVPGSEGDPIAAQICFAGAAGRRWVLDRLTAFIDQVRPDYLKWDNNFFINCNRDGHGHGAGDGNFLHQHGLYEILAGLRERFPDLIIENVSGGGNLIDFGTLRYTDVAWMDDQSAPSTHVRHNLEGLSAFFPPAYLLSFVMGNDEEPMHNAPDLPMLARSRMPGVLGLTFRSNEVAESEAAELTRQIGMYKTFRDTIRQASAALLSQQPSRGAAGDWDVLQERGDGEVLLFAFQQDGGPESVTIRPVNLDEDAMYTVTSIDRGEIGEASGRDLMDYGIEIIQSPVSAAHILTLRRRAGQ